MTSTKSAAGKSEGLVREIMRFIAREKIALVRHKLQRQIDSYYADKLAA